MKFIQHEYIHLIMSLALAPHSSTLAWRIPWMEEPGGLQSMGLQRVRHDWMTSLSLFTFMHWRRKWQPTSVFLCKTPNSGLRSKEEKPRDPINQPSRCNTQEGLLSVAQMGDSDLLGGRAHQTANWASFLYAKNHSISILRTGYKVISYTFAKQSYWYKLRGLLFKLKAILLVQTARAFVQT